MSKLKRKLAVNGVATILSVIFILAMVAVPAVATIVANTVNSAAIIDGQVKTKDLAVGAVGTGRIKNGAVTGAKIRNYTITKEDIHSASINKYKLTSGSVNTFKILDGTILARDIADGVVSSTKIADGTITNTDIAAGAAIAASKINTAGLNADSVDGKHASAFATSGHNHDTDYSSEAHNHDTTYVKKTGNQSIDGILTVSGVSYDATKTGVISVAPVAFRPDSSTTTYISHVYVTNQSLSSDLFLRAPVNLPDGARVTKLSYEFLDNTTDIKKIVAKLQKVSNGSVSADMAMVSSGSIADSASWERLDDTSISSAVVDNSNASYLIQARLSGGAGFILKGGNAYIEFEYTSPGH